MEPFATFFKVIIRFRQHVSDTLVRHLPAQTVGAQQIQISRLYRRFADIDVDVYFHPETANKYVVTNTRVVRFCEMEYTGPAEAGPACLREVLATIRDRAIPVVFPIEYRYVKADDVWLSMFHDREGCSISIHQFADEDYRPYFDEIEPIFWKYEGRPHWGKLHSLDATRLAALYPRWQDFAEVRQSLDPAGRLLNEHLRTVLVG